ncbi:MAG: HAD hydrolase family protein [Candidatus Jordarchaeaceae archaeon]
MKHNKKKLSRIRLLALDFDGVFTDNRVYVSQDGKETVCCWRSDGIGLQKLKETGVKIIVISSEINPVVEKRCAKLGIECVTGEKEKLKTLQRILEREKISPEEACFVGNDTPDLECMKFVGLSIAVKGSMREIIREADYITKTGGGRGAVREICDMIYKAKKSTS